MKGGRGKARTRFHERLGTSAAEQIGSVKSWIQRRVIQVLKAIGIAVGSVAFFNVLVWWTIIGYLVLYWLLIPRNLFFEAPLMFDFDTFQNGPALLHGSTVPFEFPVAQVYFPSYDQQWLGEVYEDRDALLEETSTTNKTEPTSYFTFPGSHVDPLEFGERYDVSVYLVVPDSKPNNDLANFMVQTELLLSGKTINETRVVARSRRPASIPYRTWLRSTLSDVMCLPFQFFLGWFLPEHKLSLTAFEGWSEEMDFRRVPNGVRVTLGDPRLTVSRAWIRFELRLRGVRYFMYYWFWTSFALLSALAISIQSGLTVTALFAKFMGPPLSKRVRYLAELPSSLLREDTDVGTEDEASESEEGTEDEEATQGESEDDFEEETPVEDEGIELQDIEEIPAAPTSSESLQSRFPSMSGPRPSSQSQTSVVEARTSPQRIVVDFPSTTEPVDAPRVEEAAVLPSPYRAPDDEQVGSPKIEATITDQAPEIHQSAEEIASQSTPSSWYQSTEESPKSTAQESQRTVRLASDSDVVLVEVPSEESSSPDEQETTEE